MVIKELEDLKREMLKLKEELKRLKEEHRSARIQELRQTTRCIHLKSPSVGTYLSDQVSRT